MSHILLFCLLSIILASIAEATSPYLHIWDSWKKRFQKSYKTRGEDHNRSRIFLKNYLEVSEHNKQHYDYYQRNCSFEMEINEFADLSPREFQNSWLGAYTFNKEKRRIGGVLVSKPIPEEFSWTHKGYVTRVKSQKGCASSWAFSVLGAVESIYHRLSGYQIDLSEEELITCADDIGAICKGGLVKKAYEYILSRGSHTEIQFPFGNSRSRPGGPRCRNNLENFEMSLAAPISTWNIVPEGENQLKRALVEAGPISVYIKVPKSMQFYKSGVFRHKDCNKENITTVNHSMLLVGYGSDKKWGEYWILKNSWGEQWGERGYLKLAMNPENDCGITSLATYPILSWVEYIHSPMGKFLNSIHRPIFGNFDPHDSFLNNLEH